MDNQHGGEDVVNCEQKNVVPATDVSECKEDGVTEESKQNSFNDEFNEIVEGKAKILFPKNGGVFYNPVQEFNRDLSIAVTRAFLSSKETKDDKASVRVLDALSASGLRALRYATEVPSVTHVTANDISQSAITTINRNIDHNRLQHVIEVSHNDAGLLMYLCRGRNGSKYDVIDLDPYGSPAEFLDPAIQAVTEGGLLCVTCTDMAGLCGNHGEASFAKYGVMPLRGKNCHEMALRCVLASLDSHAARYKRYVKPLLSVSIDFYVRIFVQVFSSPSIVKRCASKQSYVYQCSGCETFRLQPVGKVTEAGKSVKYTPGTGPVVGQLCSECDRVFHIGGPIWNGPIHDQSFVQGLLSSIEEKKKDYRTTPRLIGMLSVVSEELPDCPLYYVPDRLASLIKCSTPAALKMWSAVIRLGYKVSISHANCNALKTDAPSSVIWDVMRSWEAENPVKRENLSSNSLTLKILNKERKITATFDILPGANPASRQKKLLRFQENPTINWGPKARAHGVKGKSIPERRETNQGKRKVGPSHKEGFHKRYPCKRFKLNQCTHGDDCRYSHD